MRALIRTDDSTPSAGWSRGRIATAWQAISAAIGAVTGLAPHVLHHVGLLAGTAVVAGAGGMALFAVLGLVATVPLLLRLKRRFGSWRAPAIGLGVSAVMFSLSAFVIGPAINADPGTGGARPAPTVDHGSHHGG